MTVSKVQGGYQWGTSEGVPYQSPSRDTIEVKDCRFFNISK